MSLFVNKVEIENTFAEAFPMWGSRLIITAKNSKWANIAALSMTGYATSVIMCDCEAGIEREVAESETLDGRPGVSIMMFGFSRKALEEPMLKRIGQCVLTCPSTSVYNGLSRDHADEMLDIGKGIRFFGDGFQVKMRLGDGVYERKRFWRIPVMEGEFLIEEKFGAKKAVAGGNFLIMGDSSQAVLEAGEKAIEAIHKVPGVITPFPGGLCRSGSKVGSKYAFLKASTNTSFCPSIKNIFQSSKVPRDVDSILEIVINGLDLESVKKAMAEGISTAVKVEGVTKITAVNFEGKLGKFQIWLKDCLGGL